MKKALCLIGIIAMIGCDRLISEKKTSDYFFQEELENISWNDVDTYPLFDHCNETDTKELQRACFEKYLHQHFLKLFDSISFDTSQSINSTIVIDLLITSNHKIELQQITADTLSEKNFNSINNFITQGIKTLPNISPPLKRGVPVTMQISLPIHIKTEAN